jgi:hypothetical protein
MAGPEINPEARPQASAATGDYKLITCVLPPQVALPLKKALKAKKNIITADAHNARGVGKLTHAAHRRLGDQTEKQVLNVVVEAGRADEIFEFIYFEAAINEPHGGLMYQTSLGRGTPYVLPDLPEED